MSQCPDAGAGVSVCLQCDRPLVGGAGPLLCVLQDAAQRVMPGSEISCLVPSAVLGRDAWADYTPSVAEVGLL